MALDAEFLRAFQRVNDVSWNLRNVRVTPLSLSTITFTGTLNRALPIEDMRLAAEIGDELGFSSFRVDCDLLKRTKTTKTSQKRFRYQLPLKRHGKSVKVFHNGSVHATGCGCPLEFLEMMEALLEFIKDTAGESWGDVALVSFDIQLINTLFTVTCPATGRPMTIPPGKLMRCVRERNVRADFDTERHPSVKIPIFDEDRKVATVCVFQTGSVSIMGAKTPHHVAQAFATVCESLDACAPDVCAPDRTTMMRTTTARKPLVLEHGYPFTLYACCL